MELWVRSQKNEKLRPLLLKVNEFEIGDYDDDMNCIVANNLHCIGIYKTKERTLEVLDEIQSILNTYNRVNGKKGNYEDLDLAVKVNMLNYVYEIPKE